MCGGGSNLLRFTLSEFFKTLCQSSLSLKQSDFRVIAKHIYIFGVLDFLMEMLYKRKLYDNPAQNGTDKIDFI